MDEFCPSEVVLTDYMIFQLVLWILGGVRDMRWHWQSSPFDHKTSVLES